MQLILLLAQKLILLDNLQAGIAYLKVFSKSKKITQNQKYVWENINKHDQEQFLDDGNMDLWSSQKNIHDECYEANEKDN